ncbi:MAG: hypothetical protein S0880_27255 [Actinomycetota bacterium]|nr:hypothetical protein [Actinomycetota bacterium]
MHSLVVEIGNSSVRAARLVDGRLDLVTTSGRARSSAVTVRPDGSIVPGTTSGGVVIDDVARRLCAPVTVSPAAVASVGAAPSAESLAAALLRSVVDEAAEHGPRPTTLRLVHGGSWHPRSVAALRNAASGLGVAIETSPEPVGATTWALATGVAASDAPILVVSAGTEVIDAAVTIAGFGSTEVLGRAASIDVRHTPLDAPSALHRLVLERIGAAPDDDAVVEHADALAAACREALVRLSTGEEIAVALPLPFDGEVLVSPETLGGRMAPAVPDAFRRLRDAVESAHLAVSDVSAVVLTGSAAHSRSLVTAVSEVLDRPVVVPPRPEAAGVLGTALDPVRSPRTRRSMAARVADAGGSGDVATDSGPEGSTGSAAGRARRVITAAAVAVVVAALLATMFLARSSGDTPAVAEQGRSERTAGATG